MVTEIVHNGIRLRLLPKWPGYYAAETGDIWSIREGKEPRKLKAVNNKCLGYLTVTVYSDKNRYWRKIRGRMHWVMRPCPRYVHKLVASVWLGPRPSRRHDIGHSNSLKHDNRPSNLCWLTRAQNHQRWVDANRDEASGRIKGLRRPGAQNPVAALSQEQADRVRAMRGKATRAVVAFLMGVAPSTISRIWSGKSYRE